MCGVEIDPVTYQVRIDRYVSMHDAGRILNETIADGQIRGAFAQGVAAALYEEFSYNEEGAFLSGTFRRLSGADGERNSRRSKSCILNRRRRSPRSAPRAWPKAIA